MRTLQQQSFGCEREAEIRFAQQQEGMKRPASAGEPSPAERQPIQTPGYGGPMPRTIPSPARKLPQPTPGKH
jgi:hypothetical protein